MPSRAPRHHAQLPHSPSQLPPHLARRGDAIPTPPHMTEPSYPGAGQPCGIVISMLECGRPRLERASGSRAEAHATRTRLAVEKQVHAMPTPPSASLVSFADLLRRQRKAVGLTQEE